jgi:hypothetical protein
MSVRIQLRRDTAANWASANPILTQGEPGYESDTGKIKYGDGSTAWNSLGYAPAAAIVDGTIVNGDISATAEIAVSKLADGAARQLLQTDAAGTGVEWASNIDIPGTLDVTGAATFDSTATVTGVISANGKISFPLGTAALPSVYPGSDTNTGIYSPGADQVAISTNGAGRLFVDSSGNVGLATSSPISVGVAGMPAVTLASATSGRSGALYWSDTGLTNKASSYWFGSVFNFGTETNHPVVFTQNASEKMRLTATGLGLGTSSPGALLHVSGGRTYLGSSDGYELAFARTGNYFYVYNDGGNLSGKLSLTTSAGAGGGEIITFTQDTKRVGIGTTTPSAALEVAQTTDMAVIAGTSGTSNAARLEARSGNGTTSGKYAYIRFNNNDTNNQRYDVGTYGTDDLTFRDVKAGSTRLTLDTSGRLLVGTSTVTTTASTSTNNLLAVESANNYLGVSFTANCNDSNGSYLVLKKSRGTTAGSNAVVQSGDEIGNIFFEATDGSASRSAAAIRAFVDATPGASDMPGRIVLSTTADGASSPTERMRITSDGSTILNKTSKIRSTLGGFFDNGIASNYFYLSLTSGGSRVLDINRQSDDGNLVEFYQADILEGAISVSGSTVTYGGGHLARWSQLPNDEDPSEILKGTVMSNLDEMCEWGEEDNEQLNKIKISDVEGDPNVAGVFVSTSFSDDGPLDFFCAMTGDMIIRIAKGVTVQRGDLLMSAGDGTAKPQDDDIIRSKTIAKVTSTHVACTYDDGSYCVPCVLMAC